MPIQLHGTAMVAMEATTEAMDYDTATSMVMEVIAHTTMDEATEATMEVMDMLMVVMVVMDLTSARDPLMLNQKPKLTQTLGTASDGEADTDMEAMETIMEVMVAMDMEVIHTAMVATDMVDTHMEDMDIVDTGRLYHQSETTIHYDLKSQLENI